jgi:hypothetical protein
MGDQTPTAAELNALRERLRIPFYILAPAAGLHPSRLAKMLAGREPLPVEIGRRVENALAAEVAAIREAAAR